MGAVKETFSCNGMNATMTSDTNSTAADTMNPDTHTYMYVVVLHDCVLVPLHLERFVTAWMWIMMFSPLLTLLLLQLIKYHIERTKNMKKFPIHMYVMSLVMVLLVAVYIMEKLLELLLTTQFLMNDYAYFANIFMLCFMMIMFRACADKCH